MRAPTYLPPLLPGREDGAESTAAVARRQPRARLQRRVCSGRCSDRGCGCGFSTEVRRHLPWPHSWRPPPAGEAGVDAQHRHRRARAVEGENSSGFSPRSSRSPAATFAHVIIARSAAACERRSACTRGADAVSKESRLPVRTTCCSRPPTIVWSSSAVASALVGDQEARFHHGRGLGTSTATQTGRTTAHESCGTRRHTTARNGTPQCAVAHIGSC